MATEPNPWVLGKQGNSAARGGNTGGFLSEFEADQGKAELASL